MPKTARDVEFSTNRPGDFPPYGELCALPLCGRRRDLVQCDLCGHWFCSRGQEEVRPVERNCAESHHDDEQRTRGEE